MKEKKSLTRSRVDVITKKEEYHKTCRVQFDNETKQELTSTHETPTLYLCHQLAVTTLKNLLKSK